METRPARPEEPGQHPVLIFNIVLCVSVGTQRPCAAVRCYFLSESKLHARAVSDYGKDMLGRHVKTTRRIL
jgi:hypothetical protein